MTYRAIITPAAETDIARACQWYEENAPEQVDRPITDFETTVRRVCAHPHVPAILRRSARMWAFDIFPYELWYCCHDDAEVVEVIAVVHTRQEHDPFGGRLHNLP